MKRFLNWIGEALWCVVRRVEDAMLDPCSGLLGGDHRWVRRRCGENPWAEDDLFSGPIEYCARCGRSR